jgi:hypothetical protein
VLVITTFGFRELRSERDGRIGCWQLLWRSENDGLIFILGLGFLLGRLRLKGVHIRTWYVKGKYGSTGAKMGSDGPKIEDFSPGKFSVKGSPCE